MAARPDMECGKILVMAGSPATQNKSSLSKKEERFQDLVADALIRGHSVGKIASTLAKGDKKKYKHYHGRIRRLARRDTMFAERMANYSRAESLIALGPVTQAVIARAKRGRMDAAKFVFAQTGAYNEKIQHDHSGEVQVTLSINRPTRVEDRTKRMDLEEGIVDADVVEEDDPGT